MHLQMLSTIRRRTTRAAFSLLPRLPWEIDRTEQLTALEARSHVSKALADGGRRRIIGRRLPSGEAELFYMLVSKREFTCFGPKNGV